MIAIAQVSKTNMNIKNSKFCLLGCEDVKSRVINCKNNNKNNQNYYKNLQN